MGGVPHRRAKTVMMESFLVTAGADPEREGARGHADVGGYDDRHARDDAPRGGPRGRASDGLEMLLDDIQWRESREAEAGQPPRMDLAWVRRELGLAVATRPG